MSEERMTLPAGVEDIRDETAENVCKRCGRPVIQMREDLSDGRWIHASAADTLACEDAGAQRAVAAPAPRCKFAVRYPAVAGKPDSDETTVRRNDPL